jgi:hypothetical protein
MDACVILGELVRDHLITQETITEPCSGVGEEAR